MTVSIRGSALVRTGLATAAVVAAIFLGFAVGQSRSTAETNRYGLWLVHGEVGVLIPSRELLGEVFGTDWEEQGTYFRLLTRGDGRLDPPHQIEFFPQHTNPILFGGIQGSDGSWKLRGVFYVHETRTETHIVIDVDEKSVKVVSRRSHPLTIHEFATPNSLVVNFAPRKVEDRAARREAP